MKKYNKLQNLTQHPYHDVKHVFQAIIIILWDLSQAAILRQVALVKVVLVVNEYASKNMIIILQRSVSNGVRGVPDMRLAQKRMASRGDFHSHRQRMVPGKKKHQDHEVLLVEPKEVF